ncbi:Protein phosphatase PTC7 [Entomortierella beljakovae]|nr:Protein phosphatase PTC7 [Entomortierella beljakovae]
MLGRNATRPLGSGLTSSYSTAVSHRISHWITKPLSLVHINRYLATTQHLLISHQPYNSNQQYKHTTSLSSVLESVPSTTTPITHISSSVTSPPSASSSAQVHTSATSLQQQQNQHEVLLDKQIPYLTSNSATLSEPTTISEVDTSVTTATTPSNAETTNIPAQNNAVAFNYLLAASWHPKSRTTFRTSAALSGADGDDYSSKWWKQKLRVGKVDAGEDAFFHVSTPSRVALGVADGVGGWSEVGVDPALFSWALMDNAEAVARITDADIENIDPKNTQISKKIPLDAQSILDGAYSELVQSGKVEAGSSTACILSLCKVTGILRASNLGDSAFLLIRNNKCIYESPSQQHFWNCPYQLSVLPPGYPAAVMDTPKDAAQTSHQLQDGDVIVLATDGFWDNVFTKEAIELVDRELGGIIQETKNRNKNLIEGGDQSSVSSKGLDSDIVGKVRTLSQRLTNTARRFSLDQKRQSPFSMGARHIRAGGKIDDITVIVTLVRALGNLDNA